MSTRNRPIGTTMEKRTVRFIRITCGECENGDPFKFRRLINNWDELIGMYCTVCCSEWIRDVSNVDAPDSALKHSETNFYLNEPIQLEVNTAFQIRSARTEIDCKYFAEILKPGDHITWHRKNVYWHHSIVVEIKAESNEIVVIHWTKHYLGDVTSIRQESIKVDKDQDSLMYRQDYPDEITKANDTQLVLARARSRIGDTGYGITDNCESFATYCKTASEKSHQVRWLEKKFEECCSLAGLKSCVDMAKNGIRLVSNGIPTAASEVIPAEIIEEVLGGSQMIGAGIVIICETVSVIFDLGKAYSERKNGSISRRDFIETATRRLVEGIVSGGMAVACSIGLEIGASCLFGIPFGPVGIFVGGIIGGMLGGIAGGAVGRAIGTWLGSTTGKVLSLGFQDDRAVTKVKDLKPGDHIVLNGWCLHPRCHAIVVKHNGKDNILVVRNTYEKGVVEEWVQFSQPLFRVEYKKGACLDPNRVIENARSKIGENKYSLAFYNCKTFARYCKTIST